MSWKAGILAGGIILILLAGSNFVTYKLSYKSGYNDAVASIVIDSTVITADTVYAIADTVIRYEWLIVNEAETDTVDDVITYVTQIDTSVVIAQDTVVHLNQDISFSEGYFSILTDIQIKPIERFIEVTKTVFRTVEVPVPADPPFYNTFWFASVFWGVVAIIIAVASIL